MNKKITHFFLLLALVVQGQNLKITYTDIVSLEAPEANLKAFNAALFISKEKSLYVTQIDSLENGGKQISKTYKNKDGSISGVRTYSFPKGVYNILDRKTNIMHSNARFSLLFDYKEPLPKINWKIKDATKKIEGIPVQKATCKFRGRNYIAWFALEIPVPLGPWKLNGLPGLIIEAYDTNKELLFLFKKLEYPYKKNINFPSLNRDWKNEKELLKKKKNHVDENLKYARTIGQQFDSSARDDEEEKIRRMNFIELNF